MTILITPVAKLEPLPIVDDRSDIDKFIDSVIFPRTKPHINYRKRDLVTPLKKSMDDFERTKRMFNTRKPVGQEDIDRLNPQLQHLSNQVQQMQEEFQILIDYISGNSPVKRILKSNIESLVKEYKARIYTDKIEIDTKNVKIKHNGLLVDLGWFTITIKNNLVIVITGSNPKGYNNHYCHPHISGGTPCFGGFGPILKKAKDKGEWCKLYCLLIEYLHSHNPDSVFYSIDKWIYEYCGKCGKISTKCVCDEDEEDYEYPEDYDEDEEDYEEDQRVDDTGILGR